MIGTSMILSFLLGYIPFVGGTLSFVFLCWVDAYVLELLFSYLTLTNMSNMSIRYYCFEYASSGSTLSWLALKHCQIYLASSGTVTCFKSKVS